MSIVKTEVSRRDYDGKYVLWGLQEEDRSWIALDVRETRKEAEEARKNFKDDGPELLIETSPSA